MVDQSTVTMGPASVGQRLLWMFEQRRGENGALNIPTVARLRRRLHYKGLKEALSALVARHEALRTRIRWCRPKLMRAVASDWEPTIDTVDLSDKLSPRETFEVALRTELTTTISATDWPVRATVWTLSPDDHVICVNVHHMATDSISNRIILEELAVLYRAAEGERVDQPIDPGWQYSEWVEWQKSRLQGRARRRLVDYWTRHLDGAAAPRLGPWLKPPGARRLSGQEAAPLASDAPERMAAVAEAARSTMFTVPLALFYASLCRRTGQTDLTVLTMLSDRGRPEVFSTVGYFVSTVALRTRFSLTDSFTDLVRMCRDTFLGAVQHQAMPFHLLPPTVTRQSDVRLDDVVIHMMGDPVDFPEPFEPWDMQAESGGGRTFDLEVVIQPILGRWHVNVLYGLYRFERAFIRDLVAGFCALAEVALAEPYRSIGELIDRTDLMVESSRRCGA